MAAKVSTNSTKGSSSAEQLDLLRAGRRDQLPQVAELEDALLVLRAHGAPRRGAAEGVELFFDLSRVPLDVFGRRGLGHLVNARAHQAAEIGGHAARTTSVAPSASS